MKESFTFACLAVLIPFASAYADQGGFTNSGGSLSAGSSVANPPGTLTIAGGTLTFQSTDGTTAIAATFSESSTVKRCSGGGRGRPVTCSSTFTGTFSGTLTVNGAVQAINGSTSQVYGTNGVVATGTSIDPAGKIYVMDTGNNQLVRMDDMNGTNWTTLSGIGSGDGQFAQYVAPVAFDASGRIYIADTGNRRIVRMDDTSGTNWTTLTQSPVIGMYIFSFGSPIGVAVDAAGRIYVADAYQPKVIRVDDMTGSDWTSRSLGSGANPHSIAVDSSGMVLVGGGGAQIVDNMAGVLTSSSTLTAYYGPSYVFGATPVPLPTPRPSAISFSPPTLTFSQDVGTTSAAQTITITNFGGSPLNGLAFSTNDRFSETNDCPAALVPAFNCTVSVTFTPEAAGSQ